MCLSLNITKRVLNPMVWTKQRRYRKFCMAQNTTEVSQIFPKVSLKAVSGIQPSGIPHIGNYFGAIKTWVKLQNSGYDCIFSIVDLHSITIPQDPAKLRNSIYMTTACLLACGINPESSILFLQSQVPQHAELCWILGSFVTMARLNHMPQFKDRSNGMKEIPLGIYVYPVLQSADILLYKAVAVPVGSDQFQHIQLAQHLAKIFNNKYKNIFPYPKTLTEDASTRIKSLRQPNKKMSKSERDPRGRIELTDSPDIIREKIKKAVTDITSAVTFNPAERPGVSNLITVHSLCTGISPEKICDQTQSLDTGKYKMVVADAVIEHLKPFRQRIEYLCAHPSYICETLRKGSEKACELAAETLDEVKYVMGLSIRE